MHASGRNALVLFSGGQDSTTCLAWALSEFDAVETLGFAYGQRHRNELDARPGILGRLRAEFPAWREKLGEDHLLSLEVLSQIGGSALPEEVDRRRGIVWGDGWGVCPACKLRSSGFARYRETVA